MSETPQSQGETLRQRLVRGPLDAGTALAILEQLLAAVEPRSPARSRSRPHHA